MRARCHTSFSHHGSTNKPKREGAASYKKWTRLPGSTNVQDPEAVKEHNIEI